MSEARSSLHRRILLGLIGYLLLLSAAVFAHGLIVNEYAERLVWQTLLDSEMDHLLERSRSDPDYLRSDTDNIALYDGSHPDRLPPALRDLEPGLHDEIIVDGVERVALVRDVDGRRLFLTLDITDMEIHEREMALLMLGSSVALILLLGIVIAWGVSRLARPLRDTAETIGQLDPAVLGQRIDIPDSASSELAVIADALNNYLQRHELFVERERTFIRVASHELRTPITVISGASQLALQQPELPPAARGQLHRIRRTARDVDQLISLLLVLAKDPERIAATSDLVALDQLLPEIVEDHRSLAQQKDLTIALAPLPRCEIVVPAPILQAAIGNLLRNSIEHSDRGTIRIHLEHPHPELPATLVIEDPGHGMSPEEISIIHAQLTRGGERSGGGIGLDLISRICEHLNWRLDFASDQGQGTTTTLSFDASQLRH